MKRFILSLTVLAVSVAVALPAFAADKAKGDKARKAGKKGESVVAIAVPKKVTLNEAQQAKLEEVNKAYAPKIEAAQAKIKGIMTEERLKAQKAAVEAAKTGGKKGPELKEAVTAALNLSAEEKATYEAATKEIQALKKQAMEEFSAVLTPEQKAQLGGGGEKKKKKDAK